MTIEQLKKAAYDLIFDTDNVEYIRGICELIADVDGREGVDHPIRSIQIAEELGVWHSIIEKMY